MAHITWPASLHVLEHQLRVLSLNDGGVSILSREGHYGAPLAELWAGQVAIAPVSRTGGPVLAAFLAQLEGRLNTFGLPLLNGHFNTTPAVTGTVTETAVRGSEKLKLSAAVTPGTLLAIGAIGSAGYQVYEAFGTSGAYTLVTPRLRYAVANATAFSSDNVAMKLRLLKDDGGRPRITASHGICTIDVMEVP